MCELCKLDGSHEHKPAVRINTNSAPRGVSKSTSGLPVHSGGKATLHSAKINTNSAPRGVSKSSSGLKGRNG